MVKFNLYVKDRRVYFRCLENTEFDPTVSHFNSQREFYDATYNAYSIRVINSAMSYWFNANKMLDLYLNLNPDGVERYSVRFPRKADAVNEANKYYNAIIMFLELSSGKKISKNLELFKENTF